MDINNELAKIIKQYPIYPEYIEKEQQDLIKRKVQKLLMRLTKCLFIATSPYDVNEIILKNGIIDCDYEVLENIKDLDHNLDEYEQIFFISYDEHKIWTRNLQDRYHKGIVQDLYELLSESGFHLKQEYYENTTHKRDPYADINFWRKELLYNSEKEKMILMQKLIYTFIEIRDFKNAFSYMNEYIQCQYMNSMQMSKLKEALEGMFEVIKRKLQEKQKSVIMCWVDSVQYGEMEEMPFLYSERANTLCFENAFTVTPYTIPTYFSIFCQKRCVKDKLQTYKHDVINKKNSKLMEFLDKQNYFFSRHGIALGIFENENCSYGVSMNDRLEYDSKLRKYKDIKNYKELDCKEDICPSLLWKGVRDILLHKKAFVLVHIVGETHTPYICGNYDGEYVNDQFHPNIKQIASARDYVDQQLEFYSEIWGERVISIMMSDHGKVVSGKTGKLYRDLYHTMLMVKGQDIEKKHCDRMFSYLKFFDLVKYLLEPEKACLEDLFQDYVEIEDLDKYGLKVISQIINQSGNIEKSGLLGYCGVRTKNSMLVRRNDGKYMYFKFPCLIDQYEVGGDKLEIARLREHLPKYKVNIEDDFFIYTKVIYLAIKNHDERVESQQKKADQLLRKLFDSFSETDILALRGGGAATNEIINRMKGESRIKYIIDNSIADEVGLPEFQYIKENEIEKYPINIILITSYNFRKEMKDGLKRLDNSIKRYKVVDLYEYFQENGLQLMEDYRADKISANDMKEAYEKLCN